MNSILIESALKEYISDVTGDVQVITGSSVDSRVTPSVRIVVQSCALPEGFPMEVQERDAQYVIAVCYEADEDGSEESARTLYEAIATKINLSENECIEISGWEVLFLSAFLMDQVTDNDGSQLVYAGTFQSNFAFYEST